MPKGTCPVYVEIETGTRTICLSERKPLVRDDLHQIGIPVVMQERGEVAQEQMEQRFTVEAPRAL